MVRVKWTTLCMGILRNASNELNNRHHSGRIHTATVDVYMD